MESIIRVHDLGKQYRIGKRRSPYATLREALTSAVRSPFKKFRPNKKQTNETIWALRDINFEVKPGEIVGLIGNNGAGKSTLLKILSRISNPTTGGFELYGRTGSLLEVGTGFHNELTGRENVYLNGAILGMSRKEMDRHFSEIVEFAGVEKFIDTPVKFYSSGMMIRLAFAVAAYLEPEILLVDEVLAVGDVAFQKKCLNKMEDIGKSGRTILFVSHNMEAVGRFCDRVILLADGAIAVDGPTQRVITAYLEHSWRSQAEKEWSEPHNAPGDDVVRLRRVRILSGSQPSATIDIREPVEIEMVYEVLRPGIVMMPNCHFYSEGGLCIFVSHDLDPKWRYCPRPAGVFTSTMHVPGNFLSEGTTFVTAAVTTYEEPMKVHFIERDVIAFRVVDNFKPDSARGDYHGVMPGIVRPMMNWTTRMDGKAY